MLMCLAFEVEVRTVVEQVLDLPFVRRHRGQGGRRRSSSLNEAEFDLTWCFLEVLDLEFGHIVYRFRVQQEIVIQLICLQDVGQKRRSRTTILVDILLSPSSILWTKEIDNLAQHDVKSGRQFLMHYVKFIST